LAHKSRLIYLKKSFNGRNPMVRKGVSRFGVSVPFRLLLEFDRKIKRMGYDRSKAIQIAMRDFLTEYSWKMNEMGLAIGTMTLLYDHKTKGLEEELTEVQHAYRSIVNSAMHVHLDERNCLLVIVVKGKIRLIRKVAEELMGRRGVKQIKLTTVMS